MILLSRGCIKSFSSAKISHFCIAHLMDQVLHADDAELAQGALNEVVGGNWGVVAVELNGNLLIA